MFISGERAESVVEGYEGTLNVPVSDTVNWTNNVTLYAAVKTKRPANATVGYSTVRSNSKA